MSADAGAVYENFLCRLPIFFLTRVPAELHSDRRMKAEVQGRQAIVRGSDRFIVEPLEFPLVFFIFIFFKRFNPKVCNFPEVRWFVSILGESTGQPDLHVE